MLGHELTRRHGGQGLPDGTIDITSTARPATASGAFLPRASPYGCHGDANDYVGKALSGRTHRGSAVGERPSDLRGRGQHIIGGNVILFGATSGAGVPLRGVVGERFAVRNPAPRPSSRASATTAAEQ